MCNFLLQEWRPCMWFSEENEWLWLLSARAGSCCRLGHVLARSWRIEAAEVSCLFYVARWSWEMAHGSVLAAESVAVAARWGLVLAARIGPRAPAMAACDGRAGGDTELLSHVGCPCGLAAHVASRCRWPKREMRGIIFFFFCISI